VAAVREQEIRRGYDVRVAMAALNESLGLPLETTHALATALAPLPAGRAAAEAYQNEASHNRPELKQSELAARIAERQTEGAKAAFRPQFAARAGVEADRAEFVRHGGGNWMVGVSMRWNVFNGNSDRARLAEAQASADAAKARERAADQAIRLEVFQAWADAQAAAERLAVGAAAVAESEESLRIVKNRFGSGLTTVTELLRSETALLDARTRYLAAIHDQRIAAAQLELAVGTLSADSEVLR